MDVDSIDCDMGTQLLVLVLDLFNGNNVLPVGKTGQRAYRCHV